MQRRLMQPAIGTGCAFDCFLSSEQSDTKNHTVHTREELHELLDAALDEGQPHFTLLVERRSIKQLQSEKPEPDAAYWRERARSKPVVKPKNG